MIAVFIPVEDRGRHSRALFRPFISGKGMSGPFQNITPTRQVKGKGGKVHVHFFNPRFVPNSAPTITRAGWNRDDCELSRGLVREII